MRKLIAFDDDTFDKLKQLARDRMGAQEARHSRRPEGRASQERIAPEDTGTRQREIEPSAEKEIMTIDADPFEEGQRAARKNIPAEANPYRDGTEQRSLWAAGHESIAGEAEANESEDT